LALDAISVPGGNALSKVIPLLGLEGKHIHAVSVGNPAGAAPFTRPAGEILAQVTVGDGQGNLVAVVHQVYPGVGRGALTSFPGLDIQPGYFVFLALWQTGDGVAAAVQARVVWGEGPAPSQGAVIIETVGSVPGKKATISLGDPAAGANYALQTVPTRTRWKARSEFFELITSAVAANRLPQVLYRDPVPNIFAVHAPGSVQPASVTTDYAPGMGADDNWNSGTVLPAAALRLVTFPLKDVWLDPGDSIQHITTNVDVGDNYGPGFLEVEEWAVSG